MSEYRRFIAYIYEYVKGNKGSNVGFVKVESRNGVCKLQLHLQEVPKNETNIKVFGFVRLQGGKVGKIMLGSCNMTDNSAEFKGNTPQDKFGNSSYNLDQIAGLFLEGDEGSRFATAWDDEAIHVAQFAVEAMKDSEKVASVNGQSDLRAAEKLANHESEEAAKDQSSSSHREQRVDDANDRQRRRPPVREQYARNQRREVLQEPESVREQSENKGQVVAEQPQAEQPVAEQAKMDPSRSNPTRQDQVRRTSSRMEVDRKVPRPEHKLEDDVSKRLEESPGAEADMTEQSSGDRVHTPQAQEGNLVESRHSGHGNVNAQPYLDGKWEQFMAYYPAIQPFEDDELIECLEIAPKDIMFLRKEDWKFGRNSFLTQGYYNYRHLLLAKLKAGGYVLGVPGINENQERYMANMFGFPFFKISTATEDPAKKFGYWLRRVG